MDKLPVLNVDIVKKNRYTPKVLQFGEGNFLRAFVDWIIQKMNKNIACSKDLRYIISNTTEAGIDYNKEDKLDDKPQSSFPGELTALLYKRFTFFNGDRDKGLIIIPCELIDKNGSKLKEIILKYIDLWNLEPEFENWIENSSVFTNTLVDRIVPGFPKDHRKAIFNKLGYVDNCLVQGEIYHLWVIEDKAKKIQKEFPADKAGLNVLFVDDITPYKQRKVSILNGAHTSIVPVGYLYGIDTVRETVEHDVLGRYLKEVIWEEIIPTFNLPHNELVEFANDVITRFKNPFIRHELFSISLNSTTKECVQIK